MARSSDSNNSNNKSEVGLSNAEHILDSIIEHIEATDEPVGGDISDMSDSSQKERMPKRPARPKSDFRDIEERAAQLASMLGGAGLAYSSGAKLHLSDAKEDKQQGQNGLEAEIKATIHADDRQMDSVNAEVSRADAQIDEVPQPIKPSEQERHVTEWEADTRDEQITATAATAQQSNSSADKENDSGSEEVADDDAPEYFDLDVSVRRSDVVELNADKDEATNKAAKTPIPDLENIEKQIEALSFSLHEEDNAHYDTIAANVRDVASSEVSDEKGENHDVNERVSSLEKQIVHLLDEVKLPDQKLKDAIADVMKDELPKAVQKALASSDLVGTLKTEIATASEERRLQDVRLADSLDVLHDALKDMSERVSVVESAVSDAQTSSDDAIAKAGKIAPLAPETQPQKIEQQHPVERAQPQSSAPAPAPSLVSSKAVDAPSLVQAPQDDDFPTWLEDATQDLHLEEKSASEEQADVFATKPVNKVARSKPAANPVARTARDDVAMLNKETYVSEPASAPVTVQPQASGYQILDEVAPAIDEPVVQSESNDGGFNQVYQQRIEPEAVPAPGKSKESKFLLAARAAARAANSRAGEPVRETNNPEPIVRTVTESNFLAAAKQKEQESDEYLGEPSPTKKVRSGLFSNKVEGPNSLLVFTSLILFGTSALLLYGMARNTDKTGSVVQLNASEKKVGLKKEVLRPAIAEQVGSGKATGNANAANKGSSKSLRSKKSNSGKHSQFDGGNTGLEFRVANSAVGGGNAPYKTSTDYDNLVSSRLLDLSPMPSPVEYTGALGGQPVRGKVGSLFEEYVSFSGSNINDSDSAKSSSGLTNGKIPGAKINSSDALLASANKGDARAQYEVARRFGTGSGFQKSPAISVEWYQKSANAGYAPAIYRLATMYERGNGVTKNYKRAMELYISAADKGNVKAMHNLAVLYTGGNLGKADYLSAIKWYTKAAEYGVKDSQFNLGIIFQNGMGGKRNLLQAYKWYTLAARLGDMEARELAQGLREELPVEQLMTMDGVLRDWKAKTADKSANASRRISKAKANSKIAGASPY